MSSLFNFAKQEKAERIVISGSEKGPACRCHLPDGEEAIFNLPKKLESDLVGNLRRLLKIAPDELTSGKYCKLRDKNHDFNFQLSIVPDKFGEKIIINIIREEQMPWSLNQLGFPKNSLEAVKKASRARSGLIIISSPERQGRSSTLQAILNQLNQEDKNIYFLGRAQFQPQGINFLDDRPENWERVLKHDSDIIALEIEDEEALTLRRAGLAAATGRLVIITLPAINTLQALYKLLTSGLPLKLILDNLKLITGQELNALKRATKTKNKRQRIGAFEIFSPAAEIKAYILKNKDELNNRKFWEDLFQLATENGYSPLKLDKQQKKRAGLI